MRPKAVICGSYHRDIAGLRRLFRELEQTGVRVLSPLSLDFDSSSSVVRSRNESDFTAHELEKYHLRAIAEADFVWLHAPEGYVGLSGSFELGFAHAIQKPVFCYTLPKDETIRNYAATAGSVFEALEAIS